MFLLARGRLTCGFLLSNSVGFRAFSFLSVALHVSCSIFSVFASILMTQPCNWKNSLVLRRGLVTTSDEQGAVFLIDWMELGLATVVLLSFLVPKNPRCSCNSYSPLSSGIGGIKADKLVSAR